MKVNLPSTLTSKKMVSLFLLTFSQVDRIKAGKNFSNCLANYNNAVIYIELLKFTDNNTFPNDGTYLQLCCDTSCSSVPISTGCPSAPNIRWFPCTEVNQTVFCGDKTCAGIVGDTSITSNVTLGNCPYNLSTVANYLTTITPNNVSSGFSNWHCPTSSPCFGLHCVWDNGGWTCYNFGGNSCFLQWKGSSDNFFSTVFSSDSLTISSFSSSSPLSSFPPINSSNNNLNLTPIIAPVATTVAFATVGGLTYYLVRNKLKRKGIRKNLTEKLKELESKIRLLKLENNELQAQVLENDKSELESVLSDCNEQDIQEAVNNNNYSKISRDRVQIINKYISHGHMFIGNNTIGDHANFGHELNVLQEEHSAQIEVDGPSRRASYPYSAG